MLRAKMGSRQQIELPDAVHPVLGETAVTKPGASIAW
jgi:hypothetical protein